MNPYNLPINLLVSPILFPSNYAVDMYCSLPSVVKIFMRPHVNILPTNFNEPNQITCPPPLLSMVINPEPKLSIYRPTVFHLGILILNTIKNEISLGEIKHFKFNIVIVTLSQVFSIFDFDPKIHD